MRFELLSDLWDLSKSMVPQQVTKLLSKSLDTAIFLPTTEAVPWLGFKEPSLIVISLFQSDIILYFFRCSISHNKPSMKHPVNLVAGNPYHLPA